jgi:hypothetical protein
MQVGRLAEAGDAAGDGCKERMGHAELGLSGRSPPPRVPGGALHQHSSHMAVGRWDKQISAKRYKLGQGWRALKKTNLILLPSKTHPAVNNLSPEPHGLILHAHIRCHLRIEQRADVCGVQRVPHTGQQRGHAADEIQDRALHVCRPEGRRHHREADPRHAARQPSATGDRVTQL